MWIDRNRRYFVATARSRDDTEAYTRVRWTQNRHGPIRKNIEVQLPAVCATYFWAAGADDQQNRLRQYDLDLEKTIETNDWSLWMTSSLLRMCVSDAYMLYKGGRGNRSCIRPHDFFGFLDPSWWRIPMIWQVCDCAVPMQLPTKRILRSLRQVVSTNIWIPLVTFARTKTAKSQRGTGSFTHVVWSRSGFARDVERKVWWDTLLSHRYRSVLLSGAFGWETQCWWGQGLTTGQQTRVLR